LHYTKALARLEVSQWVDCE